MPNKRSSKQKLLVVPVDQSFFAYMDEGARQGGYASRSDFVRNAIVEELERLGISVPRELVAAPARSKYSAAPDSPPEKSQPVVNKKVSGKLPHDAVISAPSDKPSAVLPPEGTPVPPIDLRNVSPEEADLAEALGRGLKAALEIQTAAPAGAGSETKDTAAAGRAKGAAARAGSRKKRSPR